MIPGLHGLDIVVILALVFALLIWRAVVIILRRRR